MTAPAVTAAPAKAEAPKAEAKAEIKAPVSKEAPKAEAKPAKAEPKEAKAPAKKAAPKAKADKAAEPAAPADRKALDALVKEQGIDAAVKAISKIKVVDLRALAREYNGEFGIAGREIRNANKKVLIEEFSQLFKKQTK